MQTLLDEMWYIEKQKSISYENYVIKMANAHSFRLTILCVDYVSFKLILSATLVGINWQKTTTTYLHF